MKRCFTDVVYNYTQQSKSAEITVAEKRFFKRLSSAVSCEDYLKLEEELNTIYSELEKELFCCGFIKGIRFIVGCMN